jgi:hypothetical protein
MYDGENPRDVPSSFMEILNDSSMNTTEIDDNDSEEDEDVEEVEDSDAYDQNVLEEVHAAAFGEDVKGKKKRELSTTPVVVLELPSTSCWLMRA